MARKQVEAVRNIMSDRMATIRFVCSEDFSPDNRRTCIPHYEPFFIMIIDRE